MITSFFSASNWRDLYEIFFNELKRVEIETGISLNISLKKIENIFN